MTNILNKIFNSEISVEQTIEWLIGDNSQNVLLPDIEQNDSTQVEFISFFLDYLRKQCQNVLNPAIDESEIQNQKSLCDIPTKSNVNINSPVCNYPEEFPEFKLTNSEANINSPIGNTSKVKTPIMHCSPQTHVDLNMTRYESPQSHSSPLKDMNNLSLSDKNKNLSMRGWTSPHMSKYPVDDSCASNLSMTSAAPCSPISPLYTTHMTPTKLTMIKNNKSRKFSNEASSPVQNSNNRQKNKKFSPNVSVCLGDFIVAGKSNSKKKNKNNSANQSMELNSDQLNKSIDAESSNVMPQQKSRRRIKPTKIFINSNAEIQQKETFGVVSRPSTGNPKFLEASTVEINEVTSFNDERELLKLQRQKQLSIVSVTEVAQQDSIKNVLKVKQASTNVSSLELVENTYILDILAKLYGGLLVNNLIPNPMTELYFIISLITSQYKTNSEINETRTQKQSDGLFNEAESLKQLKETMGCMDLIDDNSEENIASEEKEFAEKRETSSDNKSHGINDIQLTDDKLYLNSVCNCVYFATIVLWNAKNLLSVFDRPTLALLCENNSVKIFHQTLHQFLMKLYEKKCSQSKNIKPYNHSRTLQSNVCFQVDTDNRDNFPSPLAFSTFRKQRDLFYEILKTWEDNHLQKQWSFHKMLGIKINTMISMHSDAVNYYHVARLFKSQLLLSSIKIGQTEDSLSDSNLDVLKSLKDINPEKLQQLQQRLITPVSSMGPVPPPAFPGVQEFYKEFLLSSLDPNFITILQNCFIQEIIELNDTQFVCSDIDIKESKADESTKQNYLWCISSLRLMAKFLGFLISLPYQSKINTLQSETTQIALRSRIMPPLDLRECIYEALVQKKLSLTIPWVVQYLAMLDPVSFRLPYYLDICKYLYCIYRDTQYSLNDESALLLAFSIGWFFELANFPRDIYFHWIGNIKNQKNQLANEIKIYETYKKTLPITDGTKNNIDKNNITADELNLIDDRALYICCPYLKELKLLLTSGNSNVKTNTANRHITPVSSKLSQASSETQARSLQLQLEDAFFHGHPRSVRKTVDFIVERVSSNCVKFICRTIIPKVKEKNYETIKKLWNKSLANNINNKHEIFELLSTNIRDESSNIIPQMCESKTKTSMESLLADDVLSAVKLMCIQIAVRMEIERISQWIDSYINNAIATNDMFSKFDEEESKDKTSDKIKKIQPDNPNAPWITSVINDVRNSLWELLENNGRWAVLTEETVLNNVNNIYQTLNERKNTVPSAQLALYRMSIDYAIHLIALKPVIFSSEVEEKLIEIWKLFNINDDGESFKSISGFLSLRNVKILMLSRDNTVWINYGKFLQRMLKQNLINIDDFSNDCVSLFRYEWNTQVLHSFSKCLMEAIRHYGYGDECTEKIIYLINWCIETCGTMNEYY